MSLQATLLPIDYSLYTKKVGMFLIDDTWYHNKHHTGDERWYKQYIPISSFYIDDENKHKLGKGFININSTDWDDDIVWCLTFQWGIFDNEYKLMFGENTEYYFYSADEAKSTIDKFLNKLEKLIIFL